MNEFRSTIVSRLIVCILLFNFGSDAAFTAARHVGLFRWFEVALALMAAVWIVGLIAEGVVQRGRQ